MRRNGTVSPENSAGLVAELLGLATELVYLVAELLQLRVSEGLEDATVSMFGVVVYYCLWVSKPLERVGYRIC